MLGEKIRQLQSEYRKKKTIFRLEEMQDVSLIRLYARDYDEVLE
jgi:hypothetical protein